MIINKRFLAEISLILNPPRTRPKQADADEGKKTLFIKWNEKL
jgi:hypothetical protein